MAANIYDKIALYYSLPLLGLMTIYYDSAFGKPTHELGVTVMTLYSIITVLLIFSAIFLADALRRLKKSFS
jgi:hypothetical protein